MNMNIAITTNRVTIIMFMCHASRISQPHMSHVTTYQCTSTMWFTSSSWRNSQQRQSLTKSTPTCTCTRTRTCSPKYHIMNRDIVIHYTSPCSIRAPCPNIHPPKRSFTYPGCTHIAFTIYYPHYGRKNKTYKVLLVLVLGEEYTTLCRVVLRPCDSDKSCPVLYFTVLFLTTY